MTLLNKTQFPPHGYLYREPAIPWVCPSELALLGLDAVAKALQIVRAQNPAIGLDPSYDACLEAVALYTCTRLKFDPKYCGEPNGTSPPLGDSARPRTKKKCAGCGRR